MPRRLSAEDVTIYKSLGIAAQDLAAAHHILKEAEQAGAGELIEF
jgi:alanine dehydrogenase